MAIPQSDQPLIDIEVFTLGETFKFRPFRVKEEKLLILGTESNNTLDLMKAIQQIITNCSFGKVNGDEIAIFDVQNIFIKLRSVSISNTVAVSYECNNCQKRNEVELDISSLDVNFKENHSQKIELSDKKVVIMKYPSAEKLAELADAKVYADIFDTAQACIKEIHTEEEVYYDEDMSEEEKLEFIDNLTMEDFTKIKEFFDTMPSLEKQFVEKCGTCKEDNTLYMNGYLDFFV